MVSRNCDTCKHNEFTHKDTDVKTYGESRISPTSDMGNNVDYGPLTCKKNHKRKYGINKCKDYKKNGKDNLSNFY